MSHLIQCVTCCVIICELWNNFTLKPMWELKTARWGAESSDRWTVQNSTTAKATVTWRDPASGFVFMFSQALDQHELWRLCWAPSRETILKHACEKQTDTAHRVQTNNGLEVNAVLQIALWRFCKRYWVHRRTVKDMLQDRNVAVKFDEWMGKCILIWF